MENEPKSSGSKPVASTTITLLKAVELGEYEPTQLGRFPEWHTLSTHAQYELVRKGMQNHDFQLRRLWAEINNQLNFSTKPSLQQARNNVDAQIQQLRRDEDRLMVEFTAKL
ncbi:hypothetical protein KBD71_01095 [Candidatus Woesebacteria bacterium]|nr:hypothetical protein [Candidatus Woesebacteria bacterium]